ncbi:GMC oxidoreductase [Rhizobium sp. BG4]|uniref:GMC oxidoreductase n=1 Tax=Rhizobium sp. BG4 TaxID=2613770 RepID=UPI00193E7DD6|nr:GMC oxidoreductase [Rhizobium sp. BG4]QRM45488.1 GMC family oxidoreductase [Rhizobium sp. BG4]
MTVALELKYSGLRICVLESGSEAAGERDDLGAIRSEGIEVRSDSRVRSIGGSSQTWSGFIAPLDEIDLKDRPGLHPGWPISHDELYSGSDEVGYRYKIPSRNRFGEPWSNNVEHRLPALPGVDGKIFKTQEPVTRFGRRYAHAFLSEGFDLVYGATVTSLALGSGQQELAHVVGANCATDSGTKIRIQAKRFVLATSAIEAIRILKNSGIPDNFGRLGRGFMNHPKGYIGRVTFNQPLPKSHDFFQVGDRGYTGYVGLRLSDEVQENEGLLNPYLRFEPSSIGAYPEAKQLSQTLRAFTASLRKRQFAAAGKHAAGLANLPGILQTVQRIAARLLSKRQKTFRWARVRCFMEMRPSDASYVTVLPEVADQLGTPIAFVKHDITDEDVRAVARLAEQARVALQAAGIGELTVEPDLAGLLRNDASHHLGGAAMGHDPQTSVVDTNLRVHSVDNLFLAGGMVFPTGGSANPTMTVIALSIRLARHLVPDMPRRKVVAARDKTDHAIVIGAGRRVREDVIPALEAIESIEIDKVYSTGLNAVFGERECYETASLESLTADQLQQATLVYIAVPPAQLERVLAQVTKSSVRHISLIIDTPAVDTPRIKSELAKFRQAVLGEDSVLLPWIDALPSEPVRAVRMQRSGYRYHAAALARALVGRGELAKIKTTSGKRDNMTIAFADTATATIIGPRNYRTGTLELELNGGKVLSSELAAENPIRPLLSGRLCVGFRCGSKAVHLTEQESALLGYFGAQDTVVTRMLDLKRVGLKRLIEATIRGETPYSHEFGLEDATMKW